jgi:ketosteroid isomerase-like protein
MRFQKLRLMVCAIVFFCGAFHAGMARAQGSGDKEAIAKVLHDQEAAWNKGDIKTFMLGYKDAPDTTFIGKTLRRGYQPILERYTTAYATPDAMGMLGSDYAVATGRYHLARTAAGGGEATGIFSLVLERESDGWRIILDHTS